MRKFLFVILLSLAFFNANSFANPLASADPAELKPKPRTPLVSSGSNKNTANLADVLLSSSPTLTFSNNTGLTSMATDGTGGSDNISDLDLQIFAGDKTTGNYTASTTMRWESATYFNSGNGFNGITPGPDPDMTYTGFSALIIKSSSQASNFSLKSIQMQDWGAVGPVQVAGYNNGTPVGAITVNLPSNGDGVTKNQSGELTPAFFNDVDEVRIYSNTVNIFVGVNNIKVGSPVASAVPTISSATYDASTGVLAVTAADMVAGDTMDASKLSITGQGGSYTLTSANVTASSSTAFSITLNSADKLNVNGILNKNGNDAVDATPFNLAAAGSWNTTRGSIADLTGNAITVSNVTAPTITSATYDGTTHVFTITGTGLVKARGATNDITVSLLTIKGEGDATRILSTTGNVEVLSATSFSITLAGADIAAVNALLNKNGTSSTTGTTYNLAAADDWNTLITGGNIADLTNGITVSNAKPTIQSATYNASTGVLAVAAVNIVGGDDIVSSKLSITGQGGSYTLTSANVTASSSTAFSINLNAADKLNVNGILNKNGTVAVDATTFNIAAAADWNIITASTADLTSNAITVSNVTPPTITSATYDGATGIFTITGTGLVKAIGATNDITVSAFTITGANGATRTLSTTGNVEVASATSLSITLAGADIAAVNALLNKNGSSSINGTTYNLAAADDWNTVITGGNISDLTGNGITVSNAVDIPPLFTAHPSVSTICTGANTTFSATASNAIGYQWQVDQGAGFSNVPASAPYSGTTSAILTITGATAGLNGYIYRVVATGTSSTNSNTAALTVNSAPAITSQPSASTICAGANTTFTVAASNATGYQWQVDTGAGFANITNGGVYSGATTATLTLTGATAGLSGFVYRAVVTGTCTPAATSNSAALTVNSAPAITSQPSASTICASANTTFTVAASNATGYQWQVDQGSGFANITNGGVYSGATTATLTLTGATAGLNGYIYRVVATGACTPNTTSNSAALTVNSAPAITGQPSDRTISVGSNTTFSASASNATGYQWQVDQGMGFSNVTASAPYSGTTSATLTITGATSAMNGYVYRLVATGVCTPAATSNAATLSLPVISVSGSLSALSTTYGTASMASSFSVSAVNLANEITLTAPSGFELSTNSASGYANTILVGAAGDLSATTIYVRLRAGARPVSSPYSGNITLSTPGGTTVTVATASSTVAVKPITAVLNNTSPITKIYNGTDDATLVASNYGLNGLEVCDEVTVSGTASYSNKDFGIGKTVTAGNLVLAGIDAANYTLSNNTATTTGDITKRTVNVTAVANTKVYGSPDPELGYTFGPALLTGEIFNGSLSRLAGEDVGDYDITMGSLAISNNYTIVLTTAKLSITPGALIVRADLKTKTYGDSDPSLTYTVIGASGTGNVFTGSLARTAGENVGSYSITQGTLALDGNHQMRFESSELTIAPRPLLIKADNQSKYVGAANPALTFSYSGFKAGETNSVLSKQPEISTTATTASLAGSYDIIVGGAVAQNYAIIYQQGILTINDFNSAPTLGAIANQLVCAGVGEQQVALSGISAGRETNQTVSLSVSSNNSSLFTSLAVSRGAGATGTLNYRPAAGATGTATVTITVKDNGGTDAGGVDTYTRSFTITISPLPVVTISSDKGLTVAKGETVHLTATGGTSYVWANASGIVSGQNTAILSVRPTANTTYTVTATSAVGCAITQSITIQVTEEAVAAKPTNIMSPNGDGVNDKWVIENLDLYPKNEVTVVDRSGRTVYSKKGYDNSWDATLRGLPLSEGTYYYIINYGDGKTPAKKGFITILNKR